MLHTGQLPLDSELLNWFRQGLDFAAQENYEQAVASYDRVLERRSDFYEAWYERGLALEASGYYTEAIASFDRALSLHPKREAACQIWHERGNALQYGLGEYIQAIICYDRALAIIPNHELTWQNRGNALLYGLSRSEDALICYNRTLEINPNNSIAWRNRGNALVELCQYSEAITSYENALAIDPDDDVSWHARNLVSERAGLVYHVPTTRQVSSDSEFEKPTFIEGESDTWVVYASEPEILEEAIGFQDSAPQDQWMLVIEDELGRRELFLERDSYVVGRDPKADLPLHSQFVSRHHAVLKRVYRVDGSHVYQITDGSPQGKPSTNGLLINGHKQRTWQLKPEDTVVFGPTAKVTYRLATVGSVQTSL